MSNPNHPWYCQDCDATHPPDVDCETYRKECLPESDPRRDD